MRILLAIAILLDSSGAPFPVMEEYNSSWLGWKKQLESFLNRRLSLEEETLLSLSLHEGPTPAITDSDKAAITCAVLAGGPMSSWDELADRIYSICN